jgi:hypothetical protein
MRTTRVQFSSDETSESVANRIAIAFDPGNTFKVRDKFFRLSRFRVLYPVTQEDIVEDRYTLVLPLEETPPAKEPPPQNLPPKKTLSVEPQEKAKRGRKPKEENHVLPKEGEIWRAKDPRRPQVFTIFKVTPEHAEVGKGRKISLDRFSRYEKVSGINFTE